MSATKVLGIDPGSHRTGWGVVTGSGSRLQYVASGVVHAKGERVELRLREVADGLDAVLCEHQPHAVAIEAAFHAKNAASALSLGQARGAALVCAARFGAPVFEYPPASVKQAAAGHGRATKDEVQRMVKMLLGIQIDLPPDAADALAIAICHLSAVPSLALVKRAEEALERS